MTLNIISDLRKPGLVPGKRLSPSTNSHSVIKKIKLYIMSNRMRCLHMQSVTMACHFTHNIYKSSPL